MLSLKKREGLVLDRLLRIKFVKNKFRNEEEEIVNTVSMQKKRCEKQRKNSNNKNENFQK